MSIGEYETSDESLSQWAARVAFLSLLPKLVPKAVDELSGTLLQSLQRAEKEGTSFLCVLNHIINCSERGVEWTTHYSSEQVDFYQQLTDWTNKYNLNGRWLIEHFVQMLDWWNQYPQEAGKKNMTVGLGHSENWFGESEPFRFEHPEWNYHELKQSEYLKAVEEHFRNDLDLYLKRRVSQAVASDEQRVKHTRKRGEITPTIKMEWFVLYQVEGLTPEQILDRYTSSLPESAFADQVMKAVREVSSLIGLQYRQPPRGRPKKER